MKIIYIHQYFRTRAMSGGTRSYEFAQLLKARGHDVVVISLAQQRKQSKLWDKEQIDGITVHWLKVGYSNNYGFVRRLLAFLGFVFFSSFRILPIKADLVFATSTPLTTAIPAAIYSTFRRKPMVFEVRDLWPELPIAIGALKNPILKFLARFLERMAYYRSAAVVALSPGMAAGVKEVCPSVPVTVLPNACDMELFAQGDGKAYRAERSWLGDRKMVLYAGTLGEINGVDYLVDLAAELRKSDPEIMVVIMGDGKQLPIVRERALKLGVLGRNLHIEPPVSKNQMPDVLAAADLACSLFIDLPEMRNNSANKFFDGLAAGRPVLINYGGWHRELLTEHGAGIAAHSLASSDVVERVVNCLNDPIWVAKSSEQAKNLAHTQFDRSKIAKEFVDLLESIHG